MSEFSQKLDQARVKLPFKRLLEERGSFCPWCECQSAYVVERVEQRGRITADCVEAIKRATDIVALIGSAVELKKSGNAHVGLCPFHNEKSPSFNVVPGKQMFHCFGCQKSGSVVEWVMERNGGTFRQACEQLAQAAGIPLRFEREVTRGFFECRTSGCASRSGEKAGRLDEVDYLARSHKVSLREAALLYLKESGVYKESERLAPSVMPGQRARRIKPPEVGNIEQPSAARADARPTNEEKISSSPGAGAGEDPRDPEATVPAAAEVKAEAKPPPVEVKCTGKRGEAACPEVARWRHPNFTDGLFCAGCKELAQQFFPNNWVALTNTEAVADIVKITSDDELEGAVAAVKKLRVRLGTAKAFNQDGSRAEFIARTEVSVRTAEEAIARYENEKKLARAAAKKAELKGEHELGLGFAALKWFYEQLTLSDSDQEILWKKRALTTASRSYLGLRSNGRANREILLAMEKLFDWPELVASGLWKPAEPKKKKARRPNAQFCGAGRMHKMKPGEKPDKGQWVDDDGWLWGWCEPVLIPYFDRFGRLIGLRPHKGMGTGGTVVGTPHLYIPREASGEREAAVKEEFPVVVITEGEFKAAVLWQFCRGHVGVCAIPGISFGRHYQVRQELEYWLASVKCKRVRVCFDNEDKSDRELRRRWDADKWAGFLADDLSRTVKLRGEMAVLPNAWRINGKADWDGAAAKLIHGNE